MTVVITNNKYDDYDSVDKVFYVEYGENPIRKYIGSDVVWNRVECYETIIISH